MGTSNDEKGSRFKSDLINTIIDYITKMDYSNVKSRYNSFFFARF